MYLGERIVWLGWAIFYGSVALAIGLAFVAAGQSLLVRREERDLEARFGEAYREYKRAVPRWFGRRRRGPG
jgi:protein-S-isoprenylcysteine O-methyltransferase Ste14